MPSGAGGLPPRARRDATSRWNSALPGRLGGIVTRIRDREAGGGHHEARAVSDAVLGCLASGIRQP